MFCIGFLSDNAAIIDLSLFWRGQLGLATAKGARRQVQGGALAPPGVCFSGFLEHYPCTVLSLRVLRVILDSKLSMAEHIAAILNTCSSSTYALRLLRSHGIHPRELHLVARGRELQLWPQCSTRPQPGGGSLARVTASVLNV